MWKYPLLIIVGVIVVVFASNFLLFWLGAD